MSSEEHVEEHISSGNDEFSVGQLAVALKESQVLVNPGVDKAFAHESHDAVASAANWEKFYDIINRLNAPVVSLIEAPEQHSASAGAVIGAVASGINIADFQWNACKGLDDKKGRAEWTKNLVRHSFEANPQFSYVVVHPEHRINFKGVQDVDWSARVYYYRLPIGRIKYILYACRAGVFSLLGDGGYLNWAYIGYVVSADPDSIRPRNVVFRAA